MKDKKGFTLIELLAVIAILGVVMLIVYPNIARMFTNSKKEAFKVQIKSIIKAAEARRQSDVMGGNVFSSVYCQNEDLCPASMRLSEGDDSLKYAVLFDEREQIIGVVAENKDYCYINSENVGDIDSDDFVSGGKTHFIEANVDSLTVSCEDDEETFYFHTNYVYWNSVLVPANVHYASNARPENAAIFEMVLGTADPGVSSRTKLSNSNEPVLQEVCVIGSEYSRSTCFGAWILDNEPEYIKNWFEDRSIPTTCSISGNNVTCNVGGVTCKIEDGSIGYCTDSSGERCSISPNGESRCTK